ncbi:chromosome segregation protein SMC [Candidatus Micrarchaeota archaeon]|nr:chromosome segregation protein SMC [Candidatus Micrarchaeota archaeon]
MLYISRIKLRSFKSFKYIDITLPKTFLCLAGPNGSGKSNICDAIRFVLGEISLKSLRAKKVKDLIHAGSTTAEVTILLEGDVKIEIKRAIREDGKILYRLNGKKTTRTSILETLKKHNLDESGRNIIAQGEVQRIINMGGKERRQIIDSVAGISDFEDKKNEALRELETVDAKIREGHLVLGEKMAFLNELEKEKAIAIQYSDAKKVLYNAKGSLLKVEINKAEDDLSEVLAKEKGLKASLEEKEREIAKIDAGISEQEKGRMELSKQLQEKQQTAALIKEIETYKASIGAKTQMLQDKQEDVKKLDLELVQFGKEKERSQQSASEILRSIEDFKRELKSSENELIKYGKSKELTQLNLLESELSSVDSKLQVTRESVIKIESEIKLKTDLLESKKKEFGEISQSASNPEDDGEDLEDEMDSLRKDINSTASEIDGLFKTEKELNGESAELDRKLLELREKYSVLRMQASPAAANPALKVISDLKESGNIQGIYGTVAELIKFESKYTAAVEASAGPRLLYVVVDSAGTASKIITHLKKTGAGRATFIPLKEIKQSQFKNQTSNPIISSLLDYSRTVSAAIEYVFGETILTQNMDEAKKLGIGNSRMVTLDGEIFERSGIISGGKVGSSILASAQLAKIESEINDIKERKNQIIKELSASREEASRKRAYKSELELKIKTCELELRADGSKSRAEELISNKIKTLKEEISEIEKTLSQSSTLLGKLRTEKTELEGKLSESKLKIKQHSEKIKEESDSENKRITELSSLISSVRATIEGKNKELELVKNEVLRLDEDSKQRSKEKRSSLEKIAQAKESIMKESEALRECEEKISAHSKSIEKIFDSMKKLDGQLQVFGEKRGKFRIEIERISKDFSTNEIKKVTLETRLQDTTSEFSNYREFEFLEIPREDLQRLIKQSEEKITNAGNVNMMAIEMYEKKKMEIEEMNSKIGTLDSERNAILQMISEIDLKKKEAFFETYYAVSDNFKKMFEKISVGEGFLYLDKPNTPFESGMYIKIKRGNHEHTLDSLSGGENTLVALMFIFAIQFFKPSPFYILDEVDAALDKENSKNLAKLVKQMAIGTQFILVSHNDNVMSNADAVLGVTKTEGASRIVGIKLEQMVMK